MSRMRNRARRRREGFTLIELLLVLAILVVLGSMAVAIFGGTQDQAFSKAAKSEVGLFDKQAKLYQWNTKQFPSSFEDLYKLPSGMEQSDWGGPYIDNKSVPKDPWGNEYRMASPGKKNPDSIDIWSVGKDGKDGTDDDVGNWDE